MSRLLLILSTLAFKTVFVVSVLNSEDVLMTGFTSHTQLPVPEIVRTFSPCSGEGSSSCQLLCSVSSVYQATLSWLNGSAAISFIHVTHLNMKPFLPLEVDFEDQNSYSCVLDHLGQTQSTQLNISKLCQRCSESTQTHVEVKEGDEVTLHSVLTKVLLNDLILWRFGPRMTIIAEEDHGNKYTFDCDHGRFKDRLDLDTDTGSLIIKNVTKLQAGVFKMDLINGSYFCWSFNLTVCAHLPSPVIRRSSSRCSSSSSSSVCAVECEVENVSDVTLSWYRGERVVSSVCVSENISSVSLCLEPEYSDRNRFSCVVSNSFFNQTRRLDFNRLCPEWERNRLLKITLPIVFISLIIAVVCVMRKCKSARLREYEAPDRDCFVDESSAEISPQSMCLTPLCCK